MVQKPIILYLIFFNVIRKMVEKTQKSRTGGVYAQHKATYGVIDENKHVTNGKNTDKKNSPGEGKSTLTLLY
jgi:hypothetical protein